MSTRGTYRTVHSSLPDDPDFQRLSPAAKLVFHTLRLSREHRASGIFRYYLQTIATRTGYGVKQVEKALAELATPKPGETLGWIAYDDAICWVVNGLRYDPHISLANAKHVATVKSELSELPRRKIVITYCDYYKQPYPFAWVEDTHSLQDSDSDSDSEKEKNSVGSTNEPTGFVSLWKEHPGPKGPKQDALKAYREISPPDTALVALRAQTAHKRECEKRGEFCPQLPHLHRWIRKRRWEDEIPVRGNGHGQTTPDLFSRLAAVSEEWEPAAPQVPV